MESNFHEPMTLDRAAGEAGMSVSCFERSLKNKSGMTFINYLKLSLIHILRRRRKG